MLIQQISVFIENKAGRLAEALEVLAQNKIDISALSLADTSDFGILRLIVDKPDEAMKALREHGVIVKSTEVLAVSMDDQPGGLAGVLRAVSDAGLFIEYMYAFVGKLDGKALVVLRLDQPEAAIETLRKAGLAVMDAKDVYRL